MSDAASTRPSSYPASLAWVAFAYVVVLLAAVAAAWPIRDWHPLWVVLVADVVGTVVIFGFSYALKNSSLYDPYWSVIPIPIVLYLAWHPWAYETPADGLRQWLAGGLVVLWGLRLTANWLRRWHGLIEEDWRYEKLADDTGRFYWLVSFSGIHLLPTVLVYLACLPLLPALTTGGAPLGVIDVVAIAVTLGAIVLETVSDNQLRRFLDTNTDPQRFLATGLWAHSRHPNYLGEVMFWWGVWLFGIAADPSYWWTAIGPVAMTWLFVAISIPMMDERMRQKRPAYAEHEKNVPAMFPWPGRRAAPGAGEVRSS